MSIHQRDLQLYFLKPSPAQKSNQGNIWRACFPQNTILHAQACISLICVLAHPPPDSHSFIIKQIFGAAFIPYQLNQENQTEMTKSVSCMHTHFKLVLNWIFWRSLGVWCHLTNDKDLSAWRTRNGWISSADRSFIVEEEWQNEAWRKGKRERSRGLENASGRRERERKRRRERGSQREGRKTDVGRDKKAPGFFFCYLRECGESNQWTCEIVQTYTRAHSLPLEEVWKRWGRRRKDVGRKRRARGNVGRKICGRAARGKMENKIRDQSNAGVESMRMRRRRRRRRRRGGRREGGEDIMLQVDQQGEERRKCRRGEEKGEGGH